MPDESWPVVRTVGVDRILVSFGASLSERANRAALALRAAIETQAWPGVTETTTSLVSACVVFDPLELPHAKLEAQLWTLIGQRDWFSAVLPEGRRRWNVPTVYGTELAPQLDEAAQVAGLTRSEAVASLSENPVRVQTIGFSPGMPYLGHLPEVWDIPRQQDLSPTVPAGALVVAVRQLVLFSVTTPTGWRHVGQTALQLFQPQADPPFVLRPGDEARFTPVDRDTFESLQADPMGGATYEVI